MTSKNVLEHLCVCWGKSSLTMKAYLWLCEPPAPQIDLPRHFISSRAMVCVCVWHSRQVYRRYVVGDYYRPLSSALPNSNVYVLLLLWNIFYKIKKESTNTTFNLGFIYLTSCWNISSACFKNTQTDYFYNLIKNTIECSREIAQWFKVCTALGEVLSSVLSTMLGSSQLSLRPAPGGTDTSGCCWCLHSCAHSLQTHTNTPN